MNRRDLLAAAPAVVALVGGSASPTAAAASSPILDAGRQIAALGRQYDKADVPGANMAALDATWARVWAHERTILDATPATVTEAMVVLMVAAGNLDMASSSDDTGDMVNRAMHAVDRATRFLAGTAGVTVEEFGGSLYLPESNRGLAS
jgi:formylglycine-generating enzyme required for sulfatase activity